MRPYKLLLVKCHIFPTEELKISTVGTEKFLRWNSKVPPLELKSSKRGTTFGTRICYGTSTIQLSDYPCILAEGYKFVLVASFGEQPESKERRLNRFFYQRLSLLCCATALDFSRAAIGSKYSVRVPLLLLKVYVLSLVLLKFLFCYILHVELALL